MGCGYRGFLLILFYQLGSSATKYRKKDKQKIDAEAAEGSIRGPEQVLACSFLATLLSCLHAYSIGEEQIINFNSGNPLASRLACAVISHHACCCADTLASELGILVKSNPFLITKPWKKVPPGTNGGVTYVGFIWSAIGGALIGMGAFVCDAFTTGFNFGHYQSEKYFLLNVIFGALTGLIGSVLDSILGATVQASYFDPDKKLMYCGKREGRSMPKNLDVVCGFDVLTNAQVNFVSILLCTYISAYCIGPHIYR